MLTYFNTTRKISPIKLQDNFENYEEYIKDVQEKNRDCKTTVH